MSRNNCVLPDPLSVKETSMFTHTSGQWQAIDFLPASLGLRHLLSMGLKVNGAGLETMGISCRGFLDNPGGSEVGSGGKMRAMKRNRTEAAALGQMCRSLSCTN